MEPVVRYATREDLPRVNELRQQVSELHAAGRPDIFRPGFCEALQQHVYQLFDAPEFDVLVACVGETICGFAAVQYVNRPESAYLCARRGYPHQILRRRAEILRSSGISDLSQPSRAAAPPPGGKPKDRLRNRKGEEPCRTV